jgi:hypothetical protein
MPGRDDLDEWLQHPGWVLARRSLEQRAEEVKHRLAVHQYDSLDEQRGDQAMYRMLRRIAQEPGEFFFPKSEGR